MTEEKAQEAVGRISYSTDIGVFSDADIIVEAIIEKLDIKQDYWKKVEGIATRGVFATNTSGLSINAICVKLENKVDSSVCIGGILPTSFPD